LVDSAASDGAAVDSRYVKPWKELLKDYLEKSSLHAHLAPLFTALDVKTATRVQGMSILPTIYSLDDDDDDDML
jgi:hypothetical protein